MFKKIRNAGLLAITTIAPVGFVLSCGDNSKDQWGMRDSNPSAINKLNGFGEVVEDALNDPSKSSLLFKAKIKTWVDGDTPHIYKWDETKQDYKSSYTSIRIASIDTPELHDPGDKESQDKKGEIGPFEIKWAQKATDYAMGEMPPGTEIIVWDTGDLSYDRTVGSIFYKKPGESTFNQNFSVNIVKEGLSILRLDDQAALLDAVLSDWLPMYYLFPALYDAFSYAINKKMGLHKLSMSEIAKAHTYHGIPHFDALLKIIKLKEERYDIRHREFMDKYHVYEK